MDNRLIWSNFALSIIWEGVGKMEDIIFKKLYRTKLKQSFSGQYIYAKSIPQSSPRIIYKILQEKTDIFFVYFNTPRQVVSYLREFEKPFDGTHVQIHAFPCCRTKTSFRLKRYLASLVVSLV